MIEQYPALLRLAAGLIDVVLGAAIAYLDVAQQAARPPTGLDFMATAALAIPGVVLGIGYLRTPSTACNAMHGPPSPQPSGSSL